MTDIVNRWAAEAIGVVAVAGLVCFVVAYAQQIRWNPARLTPEGRAVAYLATGLLATIVTLVAHGFTGYYPGRVLVEVGIFGTLAGACWHLFFTYRRSVRHRRTGKPEGGTP